MAPLPTAGPSVAAAGVVQPAREMTDAAGEAVWLTLRYGLFLFLSKSPTEPAPYAFIRLQDAVLRDVDYGAQHLVLAGRPKGHIEANRENCTGRENTGPGAKMSSLDVVGTAKHSPFGDPRLPLPICFLLADGRFQPFEALWLEIQFGSDEELETWARELGAACDCLDLQEKEQQASNGAKLAGPKGRGPARAPTAPMAGTPPPSPPMLEEDQEGSSSSRSGDKLEQGPRPAG